MTRLVECAHDGVVADSVPLNEAKTRLSELVRRVENGEEIVIRRGARPVARLIREASGAILPPGSVAGIAGELAEDFDAPLEEFVDHFGAP